MSLHKLNSLETQVRTLLELAENQAEATQKLLHIHENNNGGTLMKVVEDIDSGDSGGEEGFIQVTDSLYPSCCVQSNVAQYKLPTVSEKIIV